MTLATSRTTTTTTKTTTTTTTTAIEMTMIQKQQWPQQPGAIYKLDSEGI